MIKRFELYRASTWYLEDATDNDLSDFEAFFKVEHTFFKDGKCVYIIIKLWQLGQPRERSIFLSNTSNLLLPLSMV